MAEHPHAVLIREARLHLPRFGAFWLNSRPTYVNGKIIAKPGLGKGSLDLIGCVDGKFVALDGKTGSAVLSPDQRLFVDLVRKNGGIATAFHSTDEIEDILSSLRSAK